MAGSGSGEGKSRSGAVFGVLVVRFAYVSARTFRSVSRYLPIEEAIRAGRLAEAHRAWQRAARGSLTRADRLALAGLARRLNDPRRGVKLLYPLVRPPAGTPVATAAEKVEYAACLIRLGARREATALLDTLDSSKVPEALLHRAAAFVAEWDYRSAIPLYRSFLRTAEPDPYLLRVARVNLAAALVHEGEWLKAEAILQRLLSELTRAKQHYLLAVVYALGAQNLIFRGRFSGATRFLEHAETSLGGEPAREQLLLRKWRAIACFRSRPAEIEAVRALAEARRAWETVRDLDAWKAILEKDRERVLRVYFGSPQPAYREWLRSRAPGLDEIPSQFEWRAQSARSSSPTWNLAAWLKDDRVRRGERRVVAIVSEDLYRPLEWPELFDRLFESRYLDPQSAGTRVRQAVLRARRLLARDLPGLELGEENGYRLTVAKPARVVLPLERIGESPDRDCPTWRESFGTASFTVSDVVRTQGLSRRTAQRRLAELVESGGAVREGRGQSARYRLR